MAKEGDWAQIRLPSGEIRRVHLDCRATIGQVGNIEHANVHIGKAGRTRWMGSARTTAASTMNPVDHPMGGGEGRSSGRPPPVLAVGQPSKGLKTRQNKRTDKFIVRRRGEGKELEYDGSFNQKRSVHRQAPDEEGASRQAATRRRSSRPGRGAPRCCRRWSAMTFAVHNGRSSSRCS